MPLFLYHIWLFFFFFFDKKDRSILIKLKEYTEHTRGGTHWPNPFKQYNQKEKENYKVYKKSQKVR